MIWKDEYAIKGTITIVFVEGVTMFDNQIRKKTNTFLTSIGQSSDSIGLPSDFDSLIKSSFNTFKKNSYSIPLRKTYIYPENMNNEQINCVAIDMGGTHFRCAKVSLNKNGDYYIIEKLKFPLPIINCETEVDDFYGSIANNICEYLNETEKIGFCFSYDMEVTENLDAKLLGFGKKYAAPKLLNTLVAENTEKAINRIQAGKHSVHLVNDSTAALLGGMYLDSSKKNNTYLSLIYGTGFNIAYLDKLDNEERTIINTECGEFNFFKQGLIDKEIMRKSLDQGKAKTEKMVAGAYLVDLIIGVITHASESKLLPKIDFTEFQTRISLKLINDFLLGKKNIIYNMYDLKRDRMLVKYLCFGIIDRAAKIAAILTTLFSLRAKSADNKVETVGIIVEGTTFHNLKTFKKKYNNYLQEYLLPYGISFNYIYHEDINLIGAAKAA